MTSTNSVQPEDQKPVSKPKVDPQQLKSFSEMVHALEKDLSERRS